MKQTDSCQRSEGRADCMKDGEGMSQKTLCTAHGHRQQCADGHMEAMRGCWVDVGKGWKMGHL